MFGDGFLVPLEQTDKSLRIDVHAPQLRDYARGLEEGIMPEDLASVTLSGLGQAVPGEPAIPRLPRADAASALDGRLSR